MPPHNAGAPPERSSSQHESANPFLGAVRWLRAHTFVPAWYPVWARHPLVSYFGALVVLGIALALDAVLGNFLPTFRVVATLPLLAILLIALSWGVGPAMLCALLGALLVDYFFIPPFFSIWDSVSEVLQDFLVLLAGLLIAVVAGMHAVARREAERLHRGAEAALLVVQELAVTLQAQRGEMESFLAITSHELKTPLTSLKLALQLALKRLRSQQAASQDLANTLDTLLSQLAHAEMDVERLAQLVDGLLDVSRIQEGMLKLRLEPTDLAGIISEAVDEQRRIAPMRAIQFTLPMLLPEPLLVDAARIKQVVTNYLTNALKYSSAESLVEVGLDENSQRLRVWVQDHGPGISPEEQQRIWQRFYRVKGIEVQSGTGIGLGVGLYLSRKIIEAHHGQVGVDSVPGVGSTFWFTLPPGRAPHSSSESRVSSAPPEG